MRQFGRALVLLAILLLPALAVRAVDIGSGVGVNMQTEKFAPMIWMCDHRIVYDDNVEPGRISDGGDQLVERIEDYAFEGEQIAWNVLVMDKNGVEKIKDVYMTIGAKQSGHMERICVLPTKNIVVDGNITESDYKKAFTKTDSVSGCNYDIYIASDYNNFYLAYKSTSPACKQMSVFELNLNQSGVTTNYISAATEKVIKNGSAEFKIPMAAMGVTQGMTLDISFKAFFTCNKYPLNSGSVKLTLEAEKCHNEKVYNQIEANCELDTSYCRDGKIPDSCNARILEEKLTDFNPETMAFYKCKFTVETPNSMYGEYFVAPEVEDLDGQKTPTDENEFWFLNPVIALKIDGDLDFGTVRPGAVSYSPTILVGNDADTGSGVLLDMFVSGTDFYDPASSGAKCPTSNQLTLDHFRYYATSGAYSTKNPAVDGKFCIDAEGYSSIPPGNKITQAKEIIGCRDYNQGYLYQPGNVLTPGARIAMTFKLSLPEPCNGDFSDGQIFFWGEAV